jgi:hypothetical protein
MAGQAATSGIRFFLGARAFGLSKANLQGPEMTQWYLANEDKIVAAAIGADGPYVMSVSLSHGLRRLRLAYPPG